MDDIETEIATQAARWIVEEGLDYGAAKRRAAKELGLNISRSRLPSNERVEEEVLAYLRLYCADTQPAELLALRRTALVWMERMQAFRPHLSGAVWRGTATRLNDIYVQLFCDDSKQAEIELINKGVRFEVGATNGFKGGMVDVLSLSVKCEQLGEEVGLHLMIYDHDDLRGALVSQSRGAPLRAQEQEQEKEKEKEKDQLPGNNLKQSATNPSSNNSPHNFVNNSANHSHDNPHHPHQAPIGSLKALRLLLGVAADVRPASTDAV